jgi:hypothetical protein
MLTNHALTVLCLVLVFGLILYNQPIIKPPNLAPRFGYASRGANLVQPLRGCVHPSI